MTVAEDSGLRIIQEMVFSLDRSTSGAIDFQLAYEMIGSVVDFTVALPDDIAIQQSRGFSASGSSWSWDGTTESPVLHGGYHTSSDQTVGAQYVDAGEWAIVNAPSRVASWQYQGSGELEFVETYRVDGPGIASSDGAVVFLGAHETYQDQAAGQQFTLAVPQAANLAVEPAAIFDAVAPAARYLDVGGYRDDVLMIAAPSAKAEWGPLGTQAGDSGFWTLDSCPLDRPNTTWIHEYVHTRQEPQMESSMRWFLEGTTCYYATLCSMQRGDVGFDVGQSFLATESDRHATLSDPGTWSSPQTKYTKGRRAVAALDCEIRRHTDGEADFRTVWRYLNETFETADIDAFRAALAETIPDSDSLLAWIDRYIDGNDLPPVPSDPAAFGLEGDTDDHPERGESTPPDEPDPEEPEPVPEEPETGPATGDDEVEPEGTSPIEEPEEPDEGESEEPEEPAGEDEPEEPDESEQGCPICGAEIEGDTDYCPVCGTHIARTCHVCGTDAPGQEYCPECGTQLVQTCDICDTRLSGTDEYCPTCGTEV